ncbi:MAG: hypothetical protein IJ332_02765 [Clostridia bacterium]|nr:hypothetical protein [Clostridia bacterium]
MLADTLSDMVYKKVEDAFNGLECWAEATAMVILSEIRIIIEDKSLSDYDKINKISEVYKKHNTDCNVRHAD